MRRLAVICILLAGLEGVALAAGQDPAQRGKELFESTRLGTNGNGCASCHPGGGKLEKAASYDEGKLTKIVNNCIENALEGKPLPAGSADMKALLSYIRTFAAR